MEKREVAVMLSYLHAIFPNYYKENNTDAEDTIIAWSIMLRKFDSELVKKVVQNQVKQCKYHPTISEIVTACENKIQDYRIMLCEYRNTHAPLPDKCTNCTIFEDNLEVLMKCGAVLCPKSKAFESVKAKCELTEHQRLRLEGIIQQHDAEDNEILSLEDISGNM